MASSSLYFPKLVRRAGYSAFTNYKLYRQEIREDCQGRCVYCDIHENELGGAEFMTLDHFRPKKLYKRLSCDPRNLVWSCLVCNQYKGSIWPAIGTRHTYVMSGGFLDPFSCDMHQFFDVSLDGVLIPLKHPAAYMIRVLKLNRDGAARKRQKRRLEFEDREQILRVLRHALREIDDALEHPALPEDLKARFLAQKEEFARQLDAVQANAKVDFALR